MCLVLGARGYCVRMLDIRKTGRTRRRWRADRTDLHSRDGVSYATALPVRETTDRSASVPRRLNAGQTAASRRCEPCTSGAHTAAETAAFFD
jgi:hypothetical protein